MVQEEVLRLEKLEADNEEFYETMFEVLKLEKLSNELHIKWVDFLSFQMLQISLIPKKGRGNRYFFGGRWF